MLYIYIKKKEINHSFETCVCMVYGYIWQSAHTFIFLCFYYFHLIYPPNKENAIDALCYL